MGRGPGGGGVTVINNLQLPDDMSVARALQEVDFRLRIAQQQG
jgi:hypothetical protein